eukprot:TRINITY_DN24471_c0_g3_i2.p1 TRINITY_DN24471_c0_g3~~TRINITY_DN24471_c0_g3_i2.p1  ORF type:complete len:783 (+),score=240.41 TRINITY_DN24471_c0_g3_i2:237-2585(+)
MAGPIKLIRIEPQQPPSFQEVDSEIVMVCGVALGLVDANQPPHVLQVSDGEVKVAGVQQDDRLVRVNSLDTGKMPRTDLLEQLKVCTLLEFETGHFEALPAADGAAAKVNLSEDEEGDLDVAPAEDAQPPESKAQPQQLQGAKAKPAAKPPRKRKHKERPALLGYGASKGADGAEESDSGDLLRGASPESVSVSGNERTAPVQPARTTGEKKKKRRRAQAPEEKEEGEVSADEEEDESMLTKATSKAKKKGGVTLVARETVLREQARSELLPMVKKKRKGEGSSGRPRLKAGPRAQQQAAQDESAESAAPGGVTPPPGGAWEPARRQPQPGQLPAWGTPPPPAHSAAYPYGYAPAYSTSAPAAHGWHVHNVAVRRGPPAWQAPPPTGGVNTSRLPLEKDANGAFSLVANQVPPRHLDFDILNEYFSHFGPVVSLKLNPARHECTVSFGSREHAAAALAKPVLSEPGIILRPFRAHGAHPTAPSMPVGAGGSSSSRHLQLENGKALEKKRLTSELTVKRQQMLHQFTEQLKLLMSKMNDPKLSDTSREKYQALMTQIREKMSALSPPAPSKVFSQKPWQASAQSRAALVIPESAADDDDDSSSDSDAGDEEQVQIVDVPADAAAPAAAAAAAETSESKAPGDAKDSGQQPAEPAPEKATAKETTEANAADVDAASKATEAGAEKKAEEDAAKKATEQPPKEGAAGSAEQASVATGVDAASDGKEAPKAQAESSASASAAPADKEPEKKESTAKTDSAPPAAAGQGSSVAEAKVQESKDSAAAA